MCKILHVFTIMMTPLTFFDGQFKYLGDNGQRIWVVSSSEENVDFSGRNNINYRQFDIKRRISPFADIKAIASLALFMRREDFDIVVGHTPKGAMIAMIAARIAGVRTRIYYRHGLIYTTATGFKRWLFKTVEQFTSLFATHIVNVSPSLSDLAINDHLNPERKQTVLGRGTCGGIDAKNLFDPSLVSTEDKDNEKALLGISKKDFVIGFCGRICKEKGIRELIDGFNIFKNRHPGSKLLLVGPFDTRDILPDKYKVELICNPDIITTGGVEKARLPLLYSLMDVFVFPSYREGFGMSVIEASAMKVPVLVSRSHGCVDSFVEHKTGEHVEISAEGIFHGLENMKDPGLRHLMGEHGRNFVVENFDHSVMWPKISEMFSQLSVPTSLSSNYEFV